jgi:hypothetical protein
LNGPDFKIDAILLHTNLDRTDDSGAEPGGFQDAGVRKAYTNAVVD